MEEKFRNKYRIASARWQQWDYGWDAAYFVTICTKDRAPFFGNVVNGKMVLSPAGVIADVFWHEIKNHARNIELGEFVVMPNHVHGILILNGNDRNTDRSQVDQDKNDENINIPDNVDNPGGNANTPDNVDNPANNGDGNDQNDQNDQNVETRHALSLPLSLSLSIPSPLPPLSSPPPPPYSPPPPTENIGRQRFQNQGKNTISSIVGGYKSAVTKHANRLGLEMAWQSRFHDHVIRDEQSFRTISEYIINNPQNWSDDRFFT
ncbi:transposase [Telluribacter sp.]|jgi:REP element-mobilizing transposase RayT|uniref:transposase n=1 Tax=Telluribacter sp. TaxID=1978767 RepID=UPI002E16786F|nr:transposase [Telluribacter sp.]